jgi:hypothetical protein
MDTNHININNTFGVGLVGIPTFQMFYFLQLDSQNV